MEISENRLSRVVTVTLLSLSILAASAGLACAEPTSTTDSRIVTCSVDRPDLWFEGRFPMSVTWTDHVTASEDDLLDVTYLLAPQPASVRVTVPLSDYLGWLGIDDAVIQVPLGDTLIGSWSTSLTALAGIPSWAASLDLRLTGNVRMSELCCSSGSAFIQTAPATMAWSTWGARTAEVVASETPGGTVRATFTYLLGIGLTLSMFGFDVVDIIPSTTVLSSIAYPALETEIEVPVQAGIMSTAAITVSIALLVTVAAVVLVIARRRSG